MTEIELTEMTPAHKKDLEILLGLQADRNLAIATLRKIGSILHEKAGEYDWCDEYDRAIKPFGEADNDFSRAFYNEAKRVVMVEREYWLTISLAISPRRTDTDYDLNINETLTACGTYRMHEDTVIECLSDLGGENVEHVSGTNLVDWYDEAENIDLRLLIVGKDNLEQTD